MIKFPQFLLRCRNKPNISPLFVLHILGGVIIPCQGADLTQSRDWIMPLLLLKAQGPDVLDHHQFTLLSSLSLEDARSFATHLPWDKLLSFWKFTFIIINHLFIIRISPSHTRNCMYQTNWLRGPSFRELSVTGKTPKEIVHRQEENKGL